MNNMSELEYIICEAESNGEIDLYTRDKMLSILYESKSNNINTVIFDLGSVLVKSTAKENVKKTKIPEEYIESMAYTFFANAHGISETMTVSELLSYYKSKLKPELKKYAKDALYLFASSKQPFEYTVDLLKSLKKKGYKIYYLSNWNKSSFTLCKEKGIFDFLDLFDGGVISYQVNATKPGEKIYKILLNKYNLNPENCLFYDDKQENIDTANKLKIHGKLFSYMKHTEKEIFNLPEVNIQIKESVSEIDDKLTNLPKYYFASSTNMDGKTLKKRVPQNYLTKIGAEDNKTERICFADSISGCLTGLSQNIKDKDFYIHVPADNSYEFKTPTRTQVPDVDCTGEVWCTSDSVTLKCVGKLHVIEDAGKPMFYKYKMPDGKIKTAATYSWHWKWIKDMTK